MATITDRILRLAKKKGVVRPCELEAKGISRSQIYRLRDRGVLEQVGRGLYRIADADLTEHHNFAAVSKRISHGVICLLSALRFHELTTQAPFEVWIAIDVKARKPALEYPPIRVIHMSGKARTLGVEKHVIEGVAVKIYNAAKTVADCFKYRNKIGLDVAIEALRDYRKNKGSLDELWRFARICRVANVIRPYMESIA